MATPSKRNELPDDGQKGKIPYEPPKLVVHGTVEEITQNAGEKGADAIIGSNLL